MSTLGMRIKKAREDKELLQSQLAKLIDVKSAAVISNWEQDISKPDAHKIVRLCEALDISASYLLDYYGNEEFVAAPHEINIIKKYRNLDGHGIEIVDLVLEKEYERCYAQSLEKESKEISDRVSRKLRAQKSL